MYPVLCLFCWLNGIIFIIMLNFNKIKLKKQEKISNKVVDYIIVINLVECFQIVGRTSVTFGSKYEG